MTFTEPRGQGAARGARAGAHLRRPQRERPAPRATQQAPGPRARQPGAARAQHRPAKRSRRRRRHLGRLQRGRHSRRPLRSRGTSSLARLEGRGAGVPCCRDSTQLLRCPSSASGVRVSAGRRPWSGIHSVLEPPPPSASGISVPDPAAHRTVPDRSEAPGPPRAEDGVSAAGRASSCRREAGAQGCGPTLSPRPARTTAAPLGCTLCDLPRTFDKDLLSTYAQKLADAGAMSMAVEVPQKYCQASEKIEE